MNRMNKIVAATVAVLIILVSFSSLVFMAEHTHHACRGEECPVCAQLEVAVSMLRNMGTALAFIAMTTFLFLSTKVCVVFYKTICVKNTLVKLKQELLN